MRPRLPGAAVGVVAACPRGRGRPRNGRGSHRSCPLLPRSLLRGFRPRASRLGLGPNPGSGPRRPGSRPLPALGPWALPRCSADSRGPPGPGPPPRSPPSRPLLTWRAPRPRFRERAGQSCGGAGGAAGPGSLTPGRSGRRRRPPRPGAPQPGAPRPCSLARLPAAAVGPRLGPSWFPSGHSLQPDHQVDLWAPRFY